LATNASSTGAKTRIRFDRNELSGAFGDIGTDLPLIVGMVLASGLDSSSVLIVFGLLQILSGLIYGIPMAVQPLKAIAVLVITKKVEPDLIYGAGLSIGVFMFLLTMTGLIPWLSRIIPHPVIRGIQFGLGLQLSTLALKDYVRSNGVEGYILASIAFLVAILFLGNRKYPPALFVISIGVIYAILFRMHLGTLKSSFGFSYPKLNIVGADDILHGFLLLAIPQIPLSIANSILATERLAHDLFPAKDITARKIALTYSFMNVVAPFFGGIPVCHGSGGMAGHYAFGGRTGGSPLIYGISYLVLGLLLGKGALELIQAFPLPVLGIVLFFEGLTLMGLLRDIASSTLDLSTALIVGLMAANLPYGYVVGIIVGTIIYSFCSKIRWGK
jgi:xanthine/uracil/vitamin C permease (AzgA family)